MPTYLSCVKSKLSIFEGLFAVQLIKRQFLAPIRHGKYVTSSSLNKNDFLIKQKNILKKARFTLTVSIEHTKQASWRYRVFQF